MQLLAVFSVLSLSLVPANQEEADAPDIVFRPTATAGQAFDGSFQLDRHEELVEWGQIHGGQEVPSEMLPSREKTTEESTRVEFSETIVSVEDGAPTGIARAYGDLGGESTLHMSFGLEGDDFSDPIDEEAELTSVLGDESVVFTMDEDEGRLVAKPAEGSELDEDDVTGLRADMSLGLLGQPEDEALSRGDSWKLEAGALVTLLDYPGDTKLVAEEEQRMMGLDATGDTDPELEGELVLTYASVREVEGRALAVIEVSGEITRTTEATHEAQMMMEGGGGEADTAEIQVTTVEVMTPRGELHWDIELGAFVQLKLEIGTASESSEVSSFEIPDMGAIEIEQVEVLEGSIELSYSRVPAS